MLRYRADLRTLAFVGIYFWLLGCAYVAGTDLLWRNVGFVVALCLFSFIGATITHNTVHTPIFKKRSWNRLSQIVLTLVYGHPVSMFVPGHNLSHHRFTQGPRDGMRTSKLRWKSNALNILLFTATVTPSVLRENLRYVKLMRTRRPRWFRQVAMEALVMLAAFAVLLVLDWRAFILFVAIPHQFAQWGIVAINFPQHDGCDPDHAFNHSRTFPNRVINWFTLNNGFHGVHHLHPAMHWSLYPETHAKEVRPHLDPRLEDSLTGWLWKTCVWPGVRCDFRGDPVVLGPLEPDQSWVDPIVGLDDGQLGAIEDQLVA